MPGATSAATPASAQRNPGVALSHVQHQNPCDQPRCGRDDQLYVGEVDPSSEGFSRERDVQLPW